MGRLPRRGSKPIDRTAARVTTSRRERLTNTNPAKAYDECLKCAKNGIEDINNLRHLSENLRHQVVYLAKKIAITKSKSEVDELLLEYENWEEERHIFILPIGKNKRIWDFIDRKTYKKLQQALSKTAAHSKETNTNKKKSDETSSHRITKRELRQMLHRVLRLSQKLDQGIIVPVSVEEANPDSGFEIGLPDPNNVGTQSAPKISPSDITDSETVRSILNTLKVNIGRQIESYGPK